ncbi:MAG TPA: hypothetical protein VK137_04725 [Planctomycetaceae bacterium]|nr:hypothetical protein [Planctomycetaceae bacterium]
MHTDDAILDLAATAQPLPRGADGLVAALGRSRLIDAADRFRLTMVACHQLLAHVANGLLVPLD